MKKVCVISSVHQLYDIRIFHKEAKSLLRAGYEVSLVIQHDREETIDGVKIVPVETPKNRWQRLLKTMRTVYRKAVKEDADVYHFHDPELILVGLLLRLKGKPVIYDVHENVAKQIKSKKWLPLRGIVSKIYRLMERVVCRFFYLILAEDSYNQLYPDSWRKITVRNFPDLSLFPEPGATKEFDLIYLGGVTRARGIDNIIKAMALLKDQGIHVGFECIGPMSPSYQEELEQICGILGLEDQVTFHGRLNAVDAYQLVGKAKIGLAILLPYPNYIASYPTKIFEYMALQVPVITSHFPLYEEVVKGSDSGLTIDPEDNDQLADAIAELIHHPDQAERMGENGRKAVEEKYNWESESQKMLAMYEEIGHKQKESLRTNG